MMDEPEATHPSPDGDPSRFFRVLGQAEPPEEFWEGFWPSVRARLRPAEAQVPPASRRFRAVFLGASAGAMAAAAVFVAAFLATPTLRPARPVRPAPAPAAAAAGRGESAPRPVLEDLRSASARVYTFRVGEAADTTEVILIVDESLDI
jgi:hypothetical protein